MRSRNLWTGVVASVVVVAAALGLLALVRTVGVGRDTVDLPDRVGRLVALDTRAAYPGGGLPTTTAQRLRTSYAVNSGGWSDTFDGAPAATRSYLDPRASQVTYAVVAVHADAGPLVPAEGFLDPQQQGLAVPRTERVTRGDVECLLSRTNPPTAGTSYQPDQAAPDAQVCQRRSGRLTVRVTAASRDTAVVARFVEDLWDELG